MLKIIENSEFGKRYGWDKAVDNNLELLKLG